MVAPDKGEKVDRTVERVEKLGSQWEVTTVVYYVREDRYNVEVTLREFNAGLFSTGDEYQLFRTVRGTRESVKETAEEVIDELFTDAANRYKARQTDLDISVE